MKWANVKNTSHASRILQY